MQFRFNSHKNNINKKIKHPLYSAFKKYGINNFEFIIIEYVLDINELNKREQYWLDYYKSYNRDFGYNLRSKAETNRGLVITEEHRNKIALAQTGKKHTNETKEKMRLAKLDKKRGSHNLEHKLKISLSTKGRLVSDETKKRVSLSKIGKNRKPFSEEWRKNIGLASKLNWLKRKSNNYVS